MSSSAVIVPIKNPEQSKKRLSTVLSNRQRVRLVRSLTRDCLEYLSDLKPSVEVAIISSNQEITEIAGSYGFSTVEEPSGNVRLGRIVDGGIARLRRERDFEGTLVFPVDLPRIQTSSIEMVLEKARDEEVLLVPDQQRQGTNVLWRKPHDVVECQYEGTSSFNQHVAVSREQGIEPVILEDDSFGFDLDTPDDWYRMLEAPEQVGKHTRSFIKEMLIDLPTLTGGGS